MLNYVNSYDLLPFMTIHKAIRTPLVSLTMLAFTGAAMGGERAPSADGPFPATEDCIISVLGRNVDGAPGQIDKEPMFGTIQVWGDKVGIMVQLKEEFVQSIDVHLETITYQVEGDYVYADYEHNGRDDAAQGDDAVQNSLRQRLLRVDGGLRACNLIG